MNRFGLFPFLFWHIISECMLEGGMLKESEFMIVRIFRVLKTKKVLIRKRNQNFMFYLLCKLAVRTGFELLLHIICYPSALQRLKEAKQMKSDLEKMDANVAQMYADKCNKSQDELLAPSKIKSLSQSLPQCSCISLSILFRKATSKQLIMVNIPCESCRLRRYRVMALRLSLLHATRYFLMRSADMISSNSVYFIYDCKVTTFFAF